MGDLSMMISCFNVLNKKKNSNIKIFICSQDAFVYYNQAADILKSNNDFLWYGGTLEGLAALFIAKNYMIKDFINPNIDPDTLIKEKPNEQVNFFEFSMKFLFNVGNS